MKTADLLSILQEFHREKLAMLLKHLAGARVVGQYDVNNTYQYIINREEVQLSWLTAAITALGGTPSTESAEPDRATKGDAAARARAVIEEDARECADFVARWRPRVEAMEHARHRGMLRVILGETLEQQRFFEQGASGRTDLLGRRAEQIVGPAIGAVLPTRWVE